MDLCFPLLFAQRVRPAQHLQRVVGELVGLEAAGCRARRLSSGRSLLINEEPLLMRSLHHLVVEWGAPDHAGGLLLCRAYDHRGILSAVGLVVVQRPQERYQCNENLYLSGLFAHATEASLHQACRSQLSAMATSSYAPTILRH